MSRFLEEGKVPSGQAAPVPSKILDTINYVQLHLQEKLNVEALAKRVQLNEDHFSRLFLRYTGRRPVPYIHAKRIERAQYLITTTNQSFAQIAEKTGFETVPYFSKVFKNVTTLTPGEYRKGHELYSDWSEE
jgi:transcriptional regulator GlxA family with amidase domain